jgi:hypothetical protein
MFELSCCRLCDSEIWFLDSVKVKYVAVLLLFKKVLLT